MLPNTTIRNNIKNIVDTLCVCNKGLIVSICLINIIASCIICAVIAPKSEYTLQQLLAEINEDYNYVFYTTNLYKYNTFVNLNSVELYSEGLRLRCEAIMQLEESEYDSHSYRHYTRILKYNETAISKNLANRYNVNIGDTITLKSPVSDNEEILTVADIFPASYGIKAPDISNSVLIIGYRNEIAINYYEFTTFLSNAAVEQDFQWFMQNDGFILKDGLIKRLLLELSIMQFITGIMIFALQYSAGIVFVIRYSFNYYYKKILTGADITNINYELKTDLIIIGLPSMLIAFAFSFAAIKLTLDCNISVIPFIVLAYQLLGLILSYRTICRRLIGGKQK